MRERLRTAVYALLRAPEAANLTDIDHVLRIVTLAKSQLARTCATTSAAPELGRWLGVSASAIHQSLDRQRRASTLITRQRFREAGTVQGLFVGVPQQIEVARVGDRQHPLALDRPTLATLLRLVERLFAPGWRHRDGRVTPPGLLASRTGRGAPTDRLALLLLVLEARPDGRVRLCSGRVCKRGRAATTLARLMGNGCTPAGAAGILQRLQSAGAIQLVRRETSSRLRQRGGIVVPAVAQDWATMKAARRRAAASRRDTAAPPTRPRRRRGGTSPQVAEPGPAGGAEFPDNSAADTLHASHADHPGADGQADVAVGVSGEAETGVPTVAGGARAQASKTSTVRSRPGATPAGTAVTSGHRRAEAALPQLSMSTAAYRVLHEVAVLLPLMTAWEQREAARAAGAAVREVTGDVGRVARRLRFRFASAGSIASPYGWLVRIGLRRASDCGRVECESGIDVVTGLECVACGYLVEGAISRSRRASERAEGQVESPVAEPTGSQATAGAGLEIRKARAEAARLAVPCADCGSPGAAGLCTGCSRGRALKSGVGDCINLALAARADLRDYPSVRAVWEEVRSDIRSARAHARHGTQDEEIAGASELLAVTCLRDRYHQDALRRFELSPAVAAESRNAHASVMRSRHRFESSAAARRAATAAAADAAERTAKFLLRERVATVARIRAGIADRRRAQPLAIVQGSARSRERGEGAAA
ncbi:hypothetical protein ABT263_25370 [Kitasatospora sp. NPDC001603]|uniref:hypothetical protein n=1 Tax=Kitasatospora sp. NPDC001603 TaxID=3154388 RepID=UPI00332D0875